MNFAGKNSNLALSLRELERLLSWVVSEFADVAFLTTAELGECYAKSGAHNVDARPLTCRDASVLMLRLADDPQLVRMFKLICVIWIAFALFAAVSVAKIWL